MDEAISKMDGCRTRDNQPCLNGGKEVWMGKEEYEYGCGGVVDTGGYVKTSRGLMLRCNVVQSADAIVFKSAEKKMANRNISIIHGFKTPL